jgi:hypothetical protein
MYMYIYIFVLKYMYIYIFVLNVHVYIHLRIKCTVYIHLRIKCTNVISSSTPSCCMKCFVKLISIKFKEVISFLRACHGPVVSHRPLTAETRVRCRASPWERSGGQSGTRLEFSPSTSGPISQYHSANSPGHPFTHFSVTDSTQHNPSKWHQ